MPENGRSGGFALVTLPGMRHTAMLHCTQMLPDLRHDSNRAFSTWTSDPSELFTSVTDAPPLANPRD